MANKAKGEVTVTLHGNDYVLHPTMDNIIKFIGDNNVSLTIVTTQLGSAMLNIIDVCKIIYGFVSDEQRKEIDERAKEMLEKDVYIHLAKEALVTGELRVQEQIKPFATMLLPFCNGKKEGDESEKKTESTPK